MRYGVLDLAGRHGTRCDSWHKWRSQSNQGQQPLLELGTSGCVAHYKSKRTVVTQPPTMIAPLYTHSNHEMFTMYWFDVRPASQTLAQHRTRTGWTSSWCVWPAGSAVEVTACHMMTDILPCPVVPGHSEENGVIKKNGKSMKTGGSAKSSESKVPRACVIS